MLTSLLVNVLALIALSKVDAQASTTLALVTPEGVTEETTRRRGVGGQVEGVGNARAERVARQVGDARGQRQGISCHPSSVATAKVTT